MLVHADRLPDVSLAASGLDEPCRVTEAGEGEGYVVATEGVGVVAAHFFFLFLIFPKSK